MRLRTSPEFCCRIFFILAFYESEEGQREFAEWKVALDGAKTDKDSNGENVA